VLEQVWTAIRTVLAERAIPEHHVGKLVLIAPAPGAGEFAAAALAALENLARTLSTEWARYGITTSVIAPGDHTDAQQLAELVCFLLSPAGDYFSGCRFSLNVLGR
jgi:NAD(P)-dependent dehydrogenase (short-subunit alcohol dehydrogenase family)